MVRAATAAPAPDESGLTEPSFRAIFGVGAASLLREGVLPLGAFYVGLRFGGLATGIVASTVASVLLYGLERRAGREGLLVRLSLAFVLVQAAVGLVANSTVVYLAQPVLATAVWGLAFLVSVPLGRPLAGALARAWYPFPRSFQESAAFKRVFGIESLVWACYFLGRSALRLALLFHGSLEGFLAITFVTGTPVALLLFAWSIRFSIRSFSD